MAARPHGRRHGRHRPIASWPTPPASFWKRPGSLPLWTQAPVTLGRRDRSRALHVVPRSDPSLMSAPVKNRLAVALARLCERRRTRRSTRSRWLVSAFSDGSSWPVLRALLRRKIAVGPCNRPVTPQLTRLGASPLDASPRAMASASTGTTSLPRSGPTSKRSSTSSSPPCRPV